MTTIQPAESGQNTLWIQPGGPNTKPLLLATHGIDSIQENLGDVTPILQRDVSGPNRFRVAGRVRGTPEMVQIPFAVDLPAKTAEYFETLESWCRLYVATITCGKLDNFARWERLTAVSNPVIVDRTINQYVARDSNERTELTGNIRGDFPLHRYYVLDGLRVAGLTGTTGDVMRSVQPYDDGSCDDSCAGGLVPCPTLIGGQKAQVYLSADGGATWTATTAISWPGTPTLAHVLASGSVLLAWSDDATSNLARSVNGGSTWALSGLGGDVPLTGNRPFILDGSRIWAACSGGEIRYSDDFGATWTEAHDGSTTTACIAIGKQGNMLVVLCSAGIVTSKDNGATWQLRGAGPSGSGNNITLGVNDDFIWVATDQGELFYSADEGVTFSQRGITGTYGTATMRDLYWVDSYFGVLARSNVIFYTVDGGYTWTRQTMATTNSINSVHACAPDWIIAGTGNGTAGIYRTEARRQIAES